jgi:hypothetical protein
MYHGIIFMFPIFFCSLITYFIIPSSAWWHISDALSDSSVICSPDSIQLTHPEIHLRHWASKWAHLESLQSSKWKPHYDKFLSQEFKIHSSNLTKQAPLSLLWVENFISTKINPLHSNTLKIFNALTSVEEIIHNAWVAAKATNHVVVFLKLLCICETIPSQKLKVIKFLFSSFMYSAIFIVLILFQSGKL